MSDAVLAIANLKAQYCAVSDSAAQDVEAARAALAGLFADGFTGDFGYGLLEGAAAITDFLCASIGTGTVWMHHHLGSPRIIVDGDMATGEWTVIVNSRRAGQPEIGQVIGRYSDAFRLTEHGWQILRIQFTQSR